MEDRIAIDKDKTILVVEFNGKYYLLSTTPQQITCIDSMPVPPAGGEDAAEQGAAAVGGGDVTFGGVMKNVFSQMKEKVAAPFKKKGQKAEKAAKSGPRFEEQLREKLEEEDRKTAAESEKGRDAD